jgi:hypothetical protein
MYKVGMLPHNTDFSSFSDAEIQLLVGQLFHLDAGNSPTTIAGSNKRNTIIALSALDLVG